MGCGFAHSGKKSAFCFLCTLDNVLIIEDPSVPHKAALQNKTAICQFFQDALKRITKLPLSNKIQSAHVGGQESQTKRKVLAVYLQKGCILSSFFSTNGF